VTDRQRSATWLGTAIAVLSAGLVMVPPVVYQYQHFFLGWHDVGTYVRANWNFFEHGRFAVNSDGTSSFFVEQHFEPFFFLLCLPVRLGGTAGFVAAVTSALVLTAGYVYAFSATVTRASWIGLGAAAVFIANPYTHAILLNYRVEAFGMLFLLAFAHHAYNGHRRLAWLALLLALVVKEDMWVYAGVIAVLVARRDRARDTLGFGVAAFGYYLVAVLLVGRWLYPTANYLNTFYQVNGHAMTSWQIAGSLLGRWREFIPLLTTGPGWLFQASLLFAGVFSGWRYLLVCGVMLIWLTYPEGPPRSNFAFYYAYPALVLSIVNLPFALDTLRGWASRLPPPARAEAWGRWSAAGLLSLIVATDALMHRPSLVPAPIEPSVNPRKVFGRGPGVSSGVVSSLIDQHLGAEAGSVLAQFFTIPRVPQRREMYVTFQDGQRFLDDQLKPRFVLLDLHAFDPYMTAEQLTLISDYLRYGDRYLPLYDANGVLLYERRDPTAR
jgi:hypothetical protein